MSNVQKNDFWLPLIGAAAIGAAIILIPVLLNGFPLMFSDSADYMVFTPRLDRSPYYGLFIFFFHLNHFIWGPIVAQGVIVSALIWIMMYVHDVSRRAVFLGIVIVLTAFSSMPYIVGYLMADIFTPIMFLVMYILAFHYEKLPKLAVIGLLLLDCVAIAAHISNLTMAVAIFPLITLLMMFDRSLTGSRLKRLTLIAVPPVVAAAAILLFNALIFGKWSLSPSGQTFVLANMILHGPALNYLKEACPTAGYQLCGYLDQLSQLKHEFTWGTGILEHTGNFAGIADESRTIVMQTIITRPGEVTRMVVINFFSALSAHRPTAYMVSDFYYQSVLDVLHIKFGDKAADAFMSSAQMRNTLPHAALAAIDKVVTPLMFCLLAILGIVAEHRHKLREATLAAFIVCAVLGNTLFCAIVSGVHDRYQARMTWLLMLAICVIGLSLWNSRKSAENKA